MLPAQVSPSALFRCLLFAIRWGGRGAVAPLLCLAGLHAQDPAVPVLPGALNAFGVPGPATPVATESALERTAIIAARREVAATMQGGREAMVVGAAGEAGGDQVWQVQEIELWERLDSVYAEQSRAVSAREDLAAEVADLQVRQSPRAAPDRAHGDRPTFERLEQLYDQRDYFTNARDWLERDLGDAADDLQEAEATFEERERERRTIREKSDTDPAQFLSALQLAGINSRIAFETVRLRNHSLDTLRVRASLVGPGLELVLPEIAWVKEHLVRSPDQAAQRDRLRAQRAGELRAQVEAARQEMDHASLELTRHEAGPNTGNAAAGFDPWRESRRLAGSRYSLLGRQLLRIEEMRTVEEHRLAALFHTAEPEITKTRAADNAAKLRRIDSERRQVITNLIRSRRQSEALRTRVAALPVDTGAEVFAAFASEGAALERWGVTAEQEVTELDVLRTLRRRLQEELEVDLAGFSLGGIWVGTGQVLAGVWDYELFTVGDQPVRVRTLLVVLVLVIAGLFLARRISRLVGHLALTRLKWSRGRSAAWQTLLFYAFAGFIVLNIFGLFHLSLTQFTVISGALAVGLGFGSQNLINNFISGIILLVERPIAEGDLIEIDGAQLWVENIGMRSTIVRSLDNTHIIVPNSRLLDQPVTNWTLSDDVVRQRIAVGVAYGSDTRKVERVLHAVLSELKLVLSEPPPKVLFEAFGDSALQFSLIFHTQIEKRFEALTAVRHAIVEAFVDEGVVIAFPQRDLHLDTTRPLEINLNSAPPVAAVATNNPEAGKVGRLANRATSGPAPSRPNQNMKEGMASEGSKCT